MTELAYPSGLSPSKGGSRLQRLRDLLQPRAVYRFRDLAVEGLAFHSSEVRPGTLFFAIPGTVDNGCSYVDEALMRGAVGVVCEKPMNIRVPVLVVEDARRALADAAGHYFDHPSSSLQVVGVTGTNGKTTVTHMIRQCLETAGRSVGLLGTIAYEFGGRKIPATTTTPDPVRLQGYLREMADRHLHACVMEVSSHALQQQRVRGVQFDVAVFTNLSQDHLDYHDSMADYTQAKSRLFAGLRPGSVACLHADSPAAESMFEALSAGVRVVAFGRHEDASFRAVNVSCGIEGSRFTLVMPKGEVDLFLPLPGAHNVENALAAAAAAHTLGVSELTIAGALETIGVVRGRMELVGCRDGLRIYVDYAHTPEAVDRACETLRKLTHDRLTVVFGCGGDRDQGKRPLMARAAARYADILYLTSDNPRSEDPEQILDQVESGLCEQDVGPDFAYYRIADRAEAIQRAIDGARKGEVVLIAGKGHETYQILEDSVVPFDDREVARRALRGGAEAW